MSDQRHLLATWSRLGPQERRVLVLLAERIERGQTHYGRLDLAIDKRDFRREATEEWADAAIYPALAMVRRLIVAPESPLRVRKQPIFGLSWSTLVKGTILGLVAAVGLFWLCGCAALTPPASVKDLGGGVYWSQFAADRRGAVILPEGSHRVICAEPSPDVAVEATARLLLTVQYAGATGSLSPELAARVVELAGRTQTVLVLREALYRACEQSAAGNLSPADMRAVYADALATVRAMTDADRARSVRDAAEALVPLLTDPNAPTPRAWGGTDAPQ